MLKPPKDILQQCSLTAVNIMSLVDVAINDLLAGRVDLAEKGLNMIRNQAYDIRLSNEMVLKEFRRARRVKAASEKLKRRKRR